MAISETKVFVVKVQTVDMTVDVSTKKTDLSDLKSVAGIMFLKTSYMHIPLCY